MTCLISYPSLANQIILFFFQKFKPTNEKPRYLLSYKLEHGFAGFFAHW